MSKFITGIIVGIVLSTVGFNGLANLGNNAVQTIQSTAQSANTR
jgi:hypothetical protein